MKIRCDREKFLASFQTAAMFSPARSPKEILQNVKLDATPAGVTLSATDMEVGIRIVVDGVEPSGSGSITIPVDRFKNILQDSDDEFLSIETTPRSTLVRGDRSEFKLPSIDADEFPEIARFTEEKYHKIDAALLRQLVSRTEFATELESSRYALGGVLIELHENKIIGVGTDGRRLAKMEGPAEAVNGHSTADVMTIIRTQSMRLFNRSLQDSDGEVHLAARGNDVLLRTPRATFYSRLIEGRFPRWKDVFPHRGDAQHVTFTAGKLQSKLKQAAVVLSAETRGIDFCFSPGSLTLESSTADVGNAHVEMPIAYEGPKITITLDHRFVAEYLRTLGPDGEFTLEIQDGSTAAVFSADDDRYAYCVMPLGKG